MAYFSRCTTLDDLRATYRRLALKNHPDVGGDAEVMAAINAEYDRVFAQLKAKHNAQAQDGRKTTEAPDEFRAIVEVLLKLDGLEVELCGSWLWIGGDTYPHKVELKAAGCKWSRIKQKWYWHHAEQRRKSRGSTSMGAIRAKYGSVYLTASKDALATT